jgi:tetratricopeptide (TPR) repeat protein
MSNPSISPSEILRRALAVADTNPAEALDRLTIGLTQARLLGDTRAISTLARHGAAICEHAGNTQGAVELYDEAIRHDQADEYLYVAAASLKIQLAQFSEAQAYLVRALELARLHEDTDMVALATARLKTLPNV